MSISRRDVVPKGEGEGQLQRESKYGRSCLIMRLYATALVAD